jgi:hypothetical protein
MPIFVPEPKKYKYLSARRRGRRRLYAFVIAIIATLAATAFIMTSLNHN